MVAIAGFDGDYDPIVKEIGDKMVTLSLLQAKALNDYLTEVYGLEASSFVAVPLDIPKEVIKAEIPSTVTVKLMKVADQTKKISVIKSIRELTGLGLIESKTIVDKAPYAIREGVLREEAEKWKTTLEKEGGTVEFS